MSDPSDFFLVRSIVEDVEATVGIHHKKRLGC